MTDLDVLCIGETMAALAAVGAARTVDAEAFAVDPAGAESNVAVVVAQLGLRAAWAGRLGSDALGDRVLGAVGDAGVDTSAVERDSTRQTGLLVREWTGTASQVRYYRAGSAASAMSPAFVSVVADYCPRFLHLSGITPALSASCADLVDLLVHERALGSAVVSLDINLRRSIWGHRDPAPTLLRLARAADIVFIGLDEATDLWGSRSPDEVRELVPRPAVLVVKDAGRAATTFVDDKRWSVPAISVQVVNEVGAGDAFAGGWLVGAVLDLEQPKRLRLGHLCARAALVSATDRPTLPSLPELLATLGQAGEQHADRAATPQVGATS